jgi:WD40 repeat protein
MSASARFFSLFYLGLLAVSAPGQGQTGSDGIDAPTRPSAQVKLTDLYGDSLPRGAVVRFGTLRFRLKAGAFCTLAFSPDSRRILAGATVEGAIGLWDVDTGTELSRLRTRQADCWCAALSPDGKLVAIGTSNHNVHIWDLQAGKELRTLQGHSKEVASIAFSPDGKVVTSASWDKTVRLWDVATGQSLRQLTHAHAGLLSSVVYSPDGLQLASKDDENIWLWETASGKLLWQISCAQGTTNGAVAYSPQGALIVSSAADNSIRCWDAKTGKESFRFPGHREPIHALAFSPDGKTIASSGKDRTIRLWDVTSRKEKGCIINQDVDGALAFSPNGKWLAGRGGGAIRLWDTGSFEERDRWPGHFGFIMSLTFSPDRRVLVSTADTVRFWDVVSGRELRRLRPPPVEWCSDVEFSPDGKILAYTAPPSTVRLLDGATAKPISDVEVKGGGIDNITFSPDGTILATTSRDNTLRFWDTKTCKELRRWNERSFNPTFSSDGRLLVRVRRNKARALYEVHTLNVAMGMECFRGLQPDSRIDRVHFIPGTETLLAVGSEDHIVFRWSVAGNLLSARKLQGMDNRLNDNVVSPDGKLLATSEEQTGIVTLWELVTGEQIEQFQGHRSDVKCLRFSPDGLLLASGSEDTTILLWDVTGRIDKRYTPQSPLRRADLDRLWEKLREPKSAQAYRAAWTLAAVPEQAIPYLAERIPLATAVSAERLRQLLADLDSDSFKTREQAARALIALGDAVAAQLRQALAWDTLSVEARKRVQEALNAIGNDPNRLRLQRAITTLEYMHHPAAQTLLNRLTQGAPGAQVTQEAKASLARLTKRSAPQP